MGGFNQVDGLMRKAINRSLFLNGAECASKKEGALAERRRLFSEEKGVLAEKYLSVF